jgi:hypothetical protein
MRACVRACVRSDPGLTRKARGWVGVAAADPSQAAAFDASVSGLVKSLHRVQVDLAEQQADANSPLYSAKTFEELSLYVHKHTHA